MQDFEKCFSDFLDRREYDQAENALFSMVRISFLAGWQAAGGNAPPPQKLFRLAHKEVLTLKEIRSDLSAEDSTRPQAKTVPPALPPSRL